MINTALSVKIVQLQTARDVLILLILSACQDILEGSPQQRVISTSRLWICLRGVKMRISWHRGGENGVIKLLPAAAGNGGRFFYAKTLLLTAQPCSRKTRKVFLIWLTSTENLYVRGYLLVVRGIIMKTIVFNKQKHRQREISLICLMTFTFSSTTILQ